MKIFKQKQPLSSFLKEERMKSKTVGLVPTMGALHSGHMSLVKRASAENNLVVVSIFVNPTQFDNKSDLEKYPRFLEKDLETLKKVNSEVIVFTPSVEEIYANNINAQKFDYDGLEHEMEGKFRNGHFDGVGTIVKQLLEIVDPHKAYFGEKDYQQLLIIKKLVEKNHMPVEIVGCPIERENNGLAMSSRNERLPSETRKKASFIFKTLLEAKEKFGTESALDVTNWIKEKFKQEPLFDLEYIEIANADTLEPIERKRDNEKYRAFIAVYADSVRLIDNIALN
ncbi:pantoate--beta-alanine ligase [Zhouia amylolytica]|uniref:Pantothenate synthetase n=1 Tax=Zhouia amylolytica TaxID=376730 RepID=A0A1I6SGC9_9FLAO|nr:pantoate--beta-alanine ligase [Zhouia amylolytica]MCQ0111663.1 pantoate--beta-alanine ligase [Zhouia amylolytica]SFS75973.1 pantoate--beta-alanine ligase [Zhouia amylolytica]